MSFSVSRTYPQPDSCDPRLGPRERAMAVFKYLLNLEPEAAVLHPLFECITHAFEQSEERGMHLQRLSDGDPSPLRLCESIVPMLTSGPIKIDGASIKPYGSDKL